LPVSKCRINGAPGYRWGQTGKCYTYKPNDKESAMSAFSSARNQGLAIASKDGKLYEAIKLPQYVISALKRGVELHRQGLSGKGLMPATVSSASRAVGSGEWSDEKIVRASAWLKRHVNDRRQMKTPSDWNKSPKYSPAFVAWLLWGDNGDGRGAKWLHAKADQIRAKAEAAGDAKTPAPKGDRIKGGRNTGSAQTRGPAAKLSKQVLTSLSNKVRKHNSEVDGDERKRATARMLQKVWLRGSGAFSTSHRPGMTRAQWAMGRVNAFLKLLKNFKPDNSKYITDNDLLPKAHPRSSKGKNKKDESMKLQLQEGNWGMKFVALRHALGHMLHHYIEKEITDDDVAAAYIASVGQAIDVAKAMPEHGDMGKASYYKLMSIISEMLGEWKERDPYTAGGEMFYALKAIQDQFDHGNNPRHDQEDSESEVDAGYNYKDEAVMDPTEKQRADLPSAAFEPAAFFDEEGEFLRGKSKLPHHINTATDPNDNETVDIPRLRNALARFNQTDFSDFGDKVRVESRAHLERHADALLYGAEEAECDTCKREELDFLKIELGLFRLGENEKHWAHYIETTDTK